jgi:AAA family ATP:ADP antiporter
MPSSGKPEFSKWRVYLWPVHYHELKKLIPMLLIFFLLFFDYNVLRTMKDVLVVTAKSSGAEVIPFIKVWVMFPGSILMTYVFTRLSNRISTEAVFYSMLGIFLTYFLLFALVIYPLRDTLHPHEMSDRLQAALPEGFKGFVAMIRYWAFTSFYVMSELWSNIILSMLFWGFANQVTQLGEAKRFYGLFGIGANFSGIVAGLVSAYFCQYDENSLNPLKDFDEKTWQHSMNILLTLVIVAGLAAMGIFRWMTTQVLPHLPHHAADTAVREKVRGKMSMRENFGYLFKSKYLLCIAAIVISYNIVINLVEVLWKHEVRLLYPHPNDYSIYMSHVTTFIGILATLTSLLVSGNLIRKAGWTFTALLTPMILLLTSIGFFAFFFMKGNMSDLIISLFGTTPLAIVVFFGTAQNVLSRAAKYTVYDSTKEMAFIPLSAECKIKGKAAIDGVCNRLGKSGGSVIYQTLLIAFSSISASAPYVAGFLLVIISVWTAGVSLLGKKFAAMTASTPTSENSNEESLDQRPVLGGTTPSPVLQEQKV